MRAMTDENVRFERAPFDHPSIDYPEGHKNIINIPWLGLKIATDNFGSVPAVGANGMDEPAPTIEDELNE